MCVILEECTQDFLFSRILSVPPSTTEDYQLFTSVISLVTLPIQMDIGCYCFNIEDVMISETISKMVLAFASDAELAEWNR